MKKLLALAAAVTVCGSLFANGNPITWKGNGDSPRWSDGSNWEGGVAPEKGDIAVIPEDTTAYASHYSEANGGDITFINALGGIHLAGTNAVFELDGQEDGSDKTGIYSLNTPLTGNGKFISKNGVNNDRYLSLTGDNTGFAGQFFISNNMVRVRNVKALGWGNPITVYANNTYKGLRYNVGGIYSNDVFLSGLDNYKHPTYTAENLAVTNLGSVTIMAGAAALGTVHIHGGLYNVVGTYESCRISGTHVGGVGGFTPMRIMNAQTLYVDGPLHPALEAKSFELYNNKEGLVYVVASGSYLQKGCVLNMGNAGGATKVDLGGYDQVVSTLKINSSTGASTPIPKQEITSERPATLKFSATDSTAGPVFCGTVTGRASLELASDAWEGFNFPILAEWTTKGSLIANGGRIQLKPTSSFPNLKSIIANSDVEKKKDNQHAPTLLIETSEINPGKFDFVLGGTKIECSIAEGVQVDARTFKLNDAYLKAGIYGSRAAYETHPELVDETHVLACLAGTGTVKVELDGPPGMMLILR